MNFEDSSCTECVDDYYGSSCDLCMKKRHGIFFFLILFLAEVCRANITCSDHGWCNSTNGICFCSPEFAGASCSYCSSNLYGPSCVICIFLFICLIYFLTISVCEKNTTCNGHGSCIATNGSCECDLGYAGASCGTCATNYYGPTCSSCTPLFFTILSLTYFRLRAYNHL